MADFFSYLREMFEAVIRNIGDFFYHWIVLKWTNVPDDFAEYGEIWDAYSKNFGVGGYILLVITIIALLAIIAGIVFGLVLLIKKYVKFYKKELDKDKLVEEVERLNYELYKATGEKDRILDLQIASLGGKVGIKPDGKGTDNANVRFAKLVAVDNKYKELNAITEMDDYSQMPLDLLVEKFRMFAASQLGLYYDVKTIRAFFAGLGSSKIIILEGISGTGKTSLPYAMGKFFQNDAKICSVQPSWRDRSELLGYYNEFTKRFNETDFLKAIYEATYRDDVNLVILDEMNLARIEYYFAEFLSIMEMPNVSEWNIEMITNPDVNTDPAHFKDGKLLIPQNVWFVGTANNDDSTFTITDKVYDRAISLFFSNKGIPFDAEFTEPVSMTYQYLDDMLKEALTNYPISNLTLEKFDKLDSFVISKFKIAFGNRILKQITKFVPCYVACGGTEIEGLDFIFSTKILKKFESLNLAFLKTELKELQNELDKLFGKNAFKESKAYIDTLIKMN